jgi:septal ring factor EnvC (AmiA/AmiB activator)
LALCSTSLKPSAIIFSIPFNLKWKGCGRDMPTQEERLTTLEKAVANLQRETASHIREVDENLTILVGVIRHQGQDIKRIFERLDTIDQHLEEHKTLLEGHKMLLEGHTTLLEEHKALLTQILARLPERP